MRKLSLILATLIITATFGFGQDQTIRSVTTLPATCTPGNGVLPGNEVILSSGSTSTLEICTATNTWSAAGTTFSPANYGAVCDGSTDDSTAFNNLITAIGSAAASVQFPLGKTCLVGNVTVPTNVSLDFTPGAALKVVTSDTVTIKGGINDPDNHQIFFNAYASQGTVDPTTGNTALSVVKPEWWGAATGGSATTNQQAIQAAIIGAFGSSRTNASGLWKWNKELRFSGQYSVSGTLNVYHMIGFVWSCGSRLGCGLIETAGNTTLINGQSVAYGVIRDMSFSTTQSQTTSFPLVTLDYDTSQGTDITTQFLDFDHDNFVGSSTSSIGFELSRSGGGAGGNNITFSNSAFQNFSQACAMIGLGNNGTPTNLATNAINIKFQNGDFQGCTGYGMANYGGGIVDLNTVSFEDGFDSVVSGAGAQVGYDMFCYPGSSGEGCSAENVRSESLWLLAGTGWTLNNVYDVDQARILFPAATPAVGAIVRGSSAADGVYYQVTASTSGASGLGTNASPRTATGGSSTTIVDSVGGLTVNAWTGWQVSYLNGSNLQYCVITSNTATTFTCSAGWQDRFYNQTTANPVNGDRFIVEPNWGTQTTSGGITWAALTKHDMDCSACVGVVNVSMQGPVFIPGVQLLSSGGGTFFQSSRADAVLFEGQGWFTYAAPSNGLGNQLLAGLPSGGAGQGGGSLNNNYLLKPVFYSTGQTGMPGGNTLVGTANGLSAIRTGLTQDCWLGGPTSGANQVGVDICQGTTVGSSAGTGVYYVENSSATQGTSPGKRLTFDQSGNLAFPGVAEGSLQNAPVTYTVAIASGTVTATPNRLGFTTYSGTDAAVVVNNALGAMSSTGGSIFFANGVYPINSLTQETQTGCTNDYYGIGIPPNTTTAWVQFYFAGESNAPRLEGFPTNTVPGTGVIFNVTSTAISGVTGTNFVAAIWQRPSSSCGATQFSTYSNELWFRNFDVRFPTNTRGNECGMCLWAAASIKLDNVSADFNLSVNSLQSGSAPTAGASGSFGIATSFSSQNSTQFLNDVWAEGFDTCFDVEGEHVTATTIDAAYCNHSMQIGRTGGNIYHPIYINHFIDQENAGGITFGSNLQAGSVVNLTGYDIELATSGWYSRTTGGASEANPGRTGGIITYAVVTAGTGITPIQLFNTGSGANFTVYPEGALAPSQRKLQPFTDSFTRSNLSSLGPNWVNGSQGSNNNLTIVSNRAEPPNTGSGYETVFGSFSNDQYASTTVGATTSSGFIEAHVRASSSAQTYYTMFCSGTTGGVELAKVVAGTLTSLATNAQNCSAGDKIEVDAIGTAITGYYTPSAGSVPTVSLAATDSAITSGSPGVSVTAGSANTVYVTSFTGGDLPIPSGVKSLQTGVVLAVGHLPACSSGLEGTWMSVSDATGPTYNATLTGGGAVHVPVYCNGTAWTSH